MTFNRRHTFQWPRTLARLMALIVLLMAANGARAASCTATNGYYSPVVGTRTVGRDAGTSTQVIPKVGFTGSAYQVSCPGDSGTDRDATITFSVATPPIAGYTDVYPTNIPNLGVKYHFATNSGNGCNFPFDQGIPNQSYSIVCHIPAGTTLNWSWGTSVEFIKTGPLSSGPLTTIPEVSMSYTLNGQAGSWSLNPFYSGSMSGQLIIASCITPDVNVQLGTHDAAEFGGIGTGTPTATSFNINLNSCPAGMKGVLYRIDPATTAVNGAPSVVTLDSTSTAQGVGVQLLDNNGAAFPLSTDVTFSNYSKATGGTYQIPLKARYYQTGTSIHGGLANTSMTFTMTYQ